MYTPNMIQFVKMFFIPDKPADQTLIHFLMKHSSIKYSTLTASKLNECYSLIIRFEKHIP
jgi:hypothetical protein